MTRGRGGPFAILEQQADGSYALRSSYDPGLVAGIKSDIPASGRRWEPNDKVWLVDGRYAGIAAGLIRDHLGIACPVQTRAGNVTPVKETKLVRVEYLGAAKERAAGEEPTAYGFDGQGWNVAIPLSVLQGWFSIPADTRPGDSQTLYGILGLGKTADDQEIKRAFRRLAKQWHPDVCKEPDAREQFMAIRNAHDILSNADTRRKYDVGLAFESSLGRSLENVQRHGYTWRPPLRCGWLLVEGTSTLGRFNVSQVLMWEDIVDSRGRVMVSSWPMGGDIFQVSWA